MEDQLASLDPVVILLTCPVVAVAVLAFLLWRLTSGRKR